MKNTINQVMFARLRNEEHFGFHSEFVKLANEYSLSEAFEALMAIYNEHYDELGAAMEVVRTSSVTRQMVSVDNLRIAAYRRIRSAVRGHLCHAEAEKIEAAERVNDIIRHYGNVPRMSRDKRTYTVQNMLEDLREKVAASLQLLGLADWVTELETKNGSYQKLKTTRYEEWGARPAKAMDEYRQATDAAYHSVIRQLEVHGVLNPADENFVSLATALNERVDAYNRLAAQRRGIMESKTERPAETASSSSSLSVVGAG
ncbi:MAG: DUF6261 family protein [Puniceicoccales bacterium]|jgi:hypothetical protein|nr:DUF6261 family protein [Puniceicoccales bacterium]